MTRFLSRLRDDSGNTAVSLGFTVLAVALLSAAGTAAVSVATLSSAVKTTTAVASAVDLRHSQWLMESETGPAGSGELCYDAYRTCVTVSEVTSVGLVLTARYGTESAEYQQWRSNPAGANAPGTHISGFDADGRPVWVTPPAQ